MEAYISVCDVEKYYGKGETVTKAVDRISFNVAQGEFVGVMGASGSGKTTLLNLLDTLTIACRKIGRNSACGAFEKTGDAFFGSKGGVAVGF